MGGFSFEIAAGGFDTFAIGLALAGVLVDVVGSAGVSKIGAGDSLACFGATMVALSIVDDLSAATSGLTRMPYKKSEWMAIDSATMARNVLEGRGTRTAVNAKS